MVKATEAWKAYIRVPIAKLKEGGDQDVEGVVTDLGPIYKITKKDGTIQRVVNGMLKDGSGTIHISFWNEDADAVKSGDIVKIHDAWVKKYENRLQVSTGGFGKVTVTKRSKGVVPKLVKGGGWNTDPMNKKR